MLTVTRLAKCCGLSRSTVLYYESVGLLKASGRSPGNYREYTDRDLERLRQICAYRHAGLSLADIKSVLGASNQAATVLERRLLELDTEIETLRSHQRSILRLLGHRSFRRDQMITKDMWVTIMKGCGFTDEQMRAWHAEFERAAPAEHQEFLEFLHISPDEIKAIREHSKKKAAK